MPKKTALTLEQPDDEPEMTAAIAAIREAGYPVVRTSEFQLKVGPVNFWPRSGKIHIDDERKCQLKGVVALLDLLLQRRLPRKVSSSRASTPPTIHLNMSDDAERRAARGTVPYPTGENPLRR